MKWRDSMIKKVETNQEYNDALSIRKAVFIEEQQVPAEEEIDQFEDSATHFIAYDDHGQPLATARYREVDGVVKVERVAVAKNARGLGLGKNSSLSWKMMRYNKVISNLSLVHKPMLSLFMNH